MKTDRMRALKWATRATGFSRSTLANLWLELAGYQDRARVFRRIVRHEWRDRCLTLSDEIEKRDAMRAEFRRAFPALAVLIATVSRDRGGIDAD